jgi:hypothetical protein
MSNLTPTSSKSGNPTLSSVSTSTASLPPLPPGFWYYVAPNGDIFIIAQTPPTPMRIKKRQNVSPFESCVDACSSTPSCTEAIYYYSNNTCAFSTFSCNNPNTPPNADIAILAGNSNSGVTQPPCLGSLNVMVSSSYSIMSMTSTISICLPGRVTTTTLLSTVTSISCPETCPLQSSQTSSFL